MFTCMLCKFATEYDDAVAPTADGRCICLRCYERAVGDERHMDAALRRLLETALAEAA
jgi:hypothetical protein